MKRALGCLILLVLVFAGACRQTDMRTVIIRLPQVVNDACEQRVQEAIQPLKGIDRQSIVFDRAARTLTLRYDSMILANKNIEHAIIASGFDANELTATEAARAALPPECRPGPLAAPAPAAPPQP